jgi:hypothetical protein
LRGKIPDFKIGGVKFRFIQNRRMKLNLSPFLNPKNERKNWAKGFAIALSIIISLNHYPFMKMELK